MENKTFKIESNAMNHDMGFNEGIVSVSLIRKLKECRFDQVTKVVQKKTTMGSGDEISFRIFYNENGTEKNFPWVQALINSASTKECFDYMKAVFPPTVEWIDQREKVAVDAAGNKSYDLQFLPFGYSGAGLSRSLQLWIYLICLAVLIIPLIYFIVVLAKGGYRIYTNDQGLELRKFGSKKWAWGEIQTFDFTRVKVVSDGIAQNQVMKIAIIAKSGNKKSVVMRLDHAVPLMKELVERELISSELVAEFI